MAMQQIEIFDIPSPCIGVCAANNKGYCRGCLRSRDERLYWLRFSDQQKRDVLRLCQARKERIEKARLEYKQQAISDFFSDPIIEQQDLF